MKAAKVDTRAELQLLSSAVDLMCRNVEDDGYQVSYMMVMTHPLDDRSCAEVVCRGAERPRTS